MNWRRSSAVVATIVSSRFAHSATIAYIVVHDANRVRCALSRRTLPLLSIGSKFGLTDVCRVLIQPLLQAPQTTRILPL